MALIRYGRHTSKKKVIFIKKVTLTLWNRYKNPFFCILCISFYLLRIFPLWL